MKVISAPTENGGIIIGWNADNLTSNNQVFAQRYNNAGVALWIPNGVQVCTAPGFRAGNNIITDGASGAIVFFVDTRDDPNGTNYAYVDTSALVNINIYAQRLNGSGTVMWTNNGAVVCAAAGNQDNYGYGYNSSVSDGNGGAIVIFNDGRNDTPDADGNPVNNDLYAQHLNSSGMVQWSANGLPVATSVGSQYLEAVITDGTGGAVAAWTHDEEGVVYSQRIDNAGSVKWTINGIRLSAACFTACGPRMIADGAGNYLYCFLSFTTSETHLLAQKVNSAGALQWGINGATISNNPMGPSSLSNPMIVLSDNGGAIIAWADDRNVGSITGTDIYASKILSTGIWAGILPTAFTSVSNGNWNDPATWGE